MLLTGLLYCCAAFLYRERCNVDVVQRACVRVCVCVCIGQKSCEVCKLLFFAVHIIRYYTLGPFTCAQKLTKPAA